MPRHERAPLVFEFGPGDEASFLALLAFPDDERRRLQITYAIEEVRTRIQAAREYGGRYSRAQLPASGRPSTRTNTLDRRLQRAHARITGRRIPASWVATCIAHGREDWEKVTTATTSWRRLVDGRPRREPAELALADDRQRAVAARLDRYYDETTSSAINRIWHESLPVLHLALAISPWPARIGAFLAMPENAGPTADRVRAACEIGKHSIEDLMIWERGWIADAVFAAGFWRAQVLEAFPAKVTDEDLVTIVPAGLRE